jgi:hypothetical protein
MEVTYQLTANDYLRVLKASRKYSAILRWAYRLSIFFAFCLMGWATLVLIGNPSRQGFLDVLPLFLLVGFWLTFLVGWPHFSARSQFRGSPSAKAPVTLDANDPGLRFYSSYYDLTLSWAALVRSVEERDIIALFITHRIFHPIPKRAFTPEQLVQFREMLQRNIRERVS